MKSLRQLLMLTMISLVVISFSLLSLFEFAFMKKEYVDVIIESHNQTGYQAARNTQLYFEKSYSISELLTQMPEIYEFDAAQQKQVMINTLKTNPQIDLLYTVDTTGMQIAKTRGELWDRSKRFWFIKGIDTKQPYITQSYYSKINEMTATTIVFPIWNQEKLMGLLGSDIKLDTIQSFIEKISTSTIKVFIVDSEGFIVAHPDIKLVKDLNNFILSTKTELVRNQSGAVLYDANGIEQTKEVPIQVNQELIHAVKDGLSGREGFFSYKDFDGTTYYSSYRPIQPSPYSAPWTVITLEKKEQAEAFLLNTQKTNLILGLTTVAVAFILAYLLSTRITRPINDLSSLMTLASNGDLTVQSSYSGNGEIENLTKSFNTMVTMLNENNQLIKNDKINLEIKNKQIEEYSEQLEDKVAERTLELENKNSSLQNALQEIEVSRTRLLESEKKATISDFVIGLTHRMNTPLGNAFTVLSFLNESILESKVIKDPTSEERLIVVSESTLHDSLDIIERGLNSSIQLIQQIKPLQLRTKWIGYGETNLHDALQNYVDWFSKNAPDRSIMVSITCDSDLVLLVDHETANTILNAFFENIKVHAFPNKSDRDQVYVSVSTDAKELKIIIEDNGIGIMALETQKIFEPFYTTKNHEGRLGLGLSVVNTMISNNLEGTLTYQNSETGGSKFIITLPIKWVLSSGMNSKNSEVD